MSTEIHKKHLGHGRRKGGEGRALGPLNFEIWYFPIKFVAKKVVFLVSSGQNEILPLLPPLQKSFWPLQENPLLAPGKNPSDAHDFGQNKTYNAPKHKASNQ